MVIPGFAEIHIHGLTIQFEDGQAHIYMNKSGAVLSLPNPVKVISWDNFEDAERPVWSWKPREEYSLDQLPVVLALAEKLGKEFSQMQMDHINLVAKLREQEERRQERRENQRQEQAAAPTIEQRLADAIRDLIVDQVEKLRS